MASSDGGLLQHEAGSDGEGNKSEEDDSRRQLTICNLQWAIRYSPQGFGEDFGQAPCDDEGEDEAAEYVARIMETEIDARIADKEGEKGHADIHPAGAQPMARHEGEEPHVCAVGRGHSATASVPAIDDVDHRGYGVIRVARAKPAYPGAQDVGVAPVGEEHANTKDEEYCEYPPP